MSSICLTLLYAISYRVGQKVIQTDRQSQKRQIDMADIWLKNVSAMNAFFGAIREYILSDIALFFFHQEYSIHVIRMI